MFSDRFMDSRDLEELMDRRSRSILSKRGNNSASLPISPYKHCGLKENSSRPHRNRHVICDHLVTSSICELDHPVCFKKILHSTKRSKAAELGSTGCATPAEKGGAKAIYNSASALVPHYEVSPSVNEVLCYHRRLCMPLVKKSDYHLRKLRSLDATRSPSIKGSYSKDRGNKEHKNVSLSQHLPVPNNPSVKCAMATFDELSHSNENIEEAGFCGEEDLGYLQSSTKNENSDFSSIIGSIEDSHSHYDEYDSDISSDHEFSDQERLLMKEVQRRRERDFSHSIDYSDDEFVGTPEDEFVDTYTDTENGDNIFLDAPSNYTVLKKGDEKMKSSTDISEATGYSSSTPINIEGKTPSSPSTIRPYSVPVASSLLNIPSVYPTINSSDEASPALTPSLFPKHFLPNIHFPLPDEKYVPLSSEFSALLKWKVCSLTPNIVRRCSARAGFSKCTRGDSWIGYWGKHMKAESFKSIKRYQKVNHFPGSFQIGRKDRLWRNISRLQSRVGRKCCNFVPHTYVLPHDLMLLQRAWEEGSKQKWILKPPASARGIGIKVVNKWRDIPKKRPIIVQRYLADPYLINGMKFDLRIYVYVSSYEPLRIYVFREGLARFATCKYSSSMKHITNRFMHLTNYSINKRNSDFTPNTDESVCQGHKWGLLALWQYMCTELGVNTEAVWDSIKDVVIKTIISSEHCVSSSIKAFVKNSSSVHELFGFDIMLDRRLKPWLLEVNISPSLHSNSQLDINIKGRLVRDLFNIAGFQLYSKDILSGRPSLSLQERMKHSQFIQKSVTKEDRRKILDFLTNDDVRTLMTAEDELSRCGYFERAFPSSEYDKYKKYFETEKYYNILLGEWAAKYRSNSMKGVSYLRRLGNDLMLNEPAK